VQAGGKAANKQSHLFESIQLSMLLYMVTLTCYIKGGVMMRTKGIFAVIFIIVLLLINEAQNKA